VGVCFIPLLPRLIQLSDKLILFSLVMILATVDVGMSEKTTTLNWNILLNVEHVGTNMHGIMIFLRPLFTAIILLRVIYLVHKENLPRKEVV